MKRNPFRKTVFDKVINLVRRKPDRHDQAPEPRKIRKHKTRLGRSATTNKKRALLRKTNKMARASRRKNFLLARKSRKKTSRRNR